LSAWEWRDLKK